MRRTIIPSILVCLILTLNISAEIITLEDVQDATNWGDYFLPPGTDPIAGMPPKYHEYYRWDNEDWGWTHTVNFEGPVHEILFVRLEIEAYDVDLYDQEINVIYGDDLYLGTLIPPPGQPYGANGGAYEAPWHITAIPLRPEALEALMDGQMDIWIDIDALTAMDPGDGCEAITISYSKLTVIYTDVPLTEPYVPPAEPYIPPNPYDYDIPEDSDPSTDPNDDNGDYPSEDPGENPTENPNDPPQYPHIPPDDVYISPDDPSIMIYTLSPVDRSKPRINDTGDGISKIGMEQAWLAFDLSSIPDKDQVISASLSAYLLDFNGDPSQRSLWYDSDDSWIGGLDSDPGDKKAADTIIGTVVHNYTVYSWETIDITHDWTNDLIDDYITFMMTGPANGSYASGSVGLDVDMAFGITASPKLTLQVLFDADSNVTNDKIFDLGPEEIVQINETGIDIGTYSVPSFTDWNNDGFSDLIIGTGAGKVLVYLNNGFGLEPQFSDKDSQSFYAQSYNSDLSCTPSGCMGCFPRVVYWDQDSRKDLLVGQSDGTIKIFLNINTDEDPKFDDGTLLTVGQGAYETYINVGSRATPTVVDWNNDGRKDLVSGAYDGKIHIFINEGTDSEPVFLVETFALENDSSLIVPGKRSSPEVLDLDFDGKKDILTGNTDGELLLYSNIGTDEAPVFSGFEPVDSNGAPLDLLETRSRPFVCYWDADGYPDVLIGASDGQIHLFRCNILKADFDVDGDIDFEDWDKFAAFWSQSDCAPCSSSADLNSDGKVDYKDASWFSENWLISTK